MVLCIILFILKIYELNDYDFVSFEKSLKTCYKQYFGRALST